MTTEEKNIPACIGIILDGNRRWAKERGLPTFEGHRRGLNNVAPIILAARDFGVKNVIVYAFSTENWNRDMKEVSYLMKIFGSITKKTLNNFYKEGVALRFVGQRERFSKSLQRIMDDAEEGSPKDPQITLWICLSYGGRADIVQAADKLAKSGVPITEESISQNVWTAGMPDPDLIIRTSGEQRLSNFLIWQAAYSELFFVKEYWPAFTKADLEAALHEYASRKRRLGK